MHAGVSGWASGGPGCGRRRRPATGGAATLWRQPTERNVDWHLLCLGGRAAAAAADNLRMHGDRPSAASHRRHRSTAARSACLPPSHSAPSPRSSPSAPAALSVKNEYEEDEDSGSDYAPDGSDGAPSDGGGGSGSDEDYLAEERAPKAAKKKAAAKKAAPKRKAAAKGAREGGRRRCAGGAGSAPTAARRPNRRLCALPHCPPAAAAAAAVKEEEGEDEEKLKAKKGKAAKVTEASRCCCLRSPPTERGARGGSALGGCPAQRSCPLTLTPASSPSSPRLLQPTSVEGGWVLHPPSLIYK